MVTINLLLIIQISATPQMVLRQDSAPIVYGLSLLLLIVLFLLARSFFRGRIIAQRLAGLEKRNNTLQENAGDATVILSATGKLIYASTSVYKVVGYTVKELLAMDIASLAHPEDIEGLQQVMMQVIALPGQPVQGHTGRMLHKDGTWHWYEAVVTNMLHDPEIAGIVDNFRDVTDRVLVEEKILKANRMYAFISAVNQTLVHEEDQESVFQEACRIAVEFGKFEMAWIGLLDAGGQSISLTESHGMPDEDKPKFAGSRYTPQGPINHVLTTDGSYVCNDIAHGLKLPTWEAYAASRNLSSLMILPIRKSGRIIGMFSIYSAQLNFFDRQQIELLEEVAKDISFAMDIFEKEIQRGKAQDRMRHTELRLNEAQAIARLGSWETNFATGMSVWSEEARRICGVPASQKSLSHQDWLDCIHPDDLERVLQTTRQAEASLTGSELYHRIIRPDGKIRHVYTKTEFDFSEGLPIGLHGIIHDITDMRELQYARAQSEADLVMISAEREKLVGDLVKRNKDLEQFSYIISHNLRAPVANILGIFEVMRTAELSQDEEQFLRDGLASGVTKLDHVIKDLNNILRLDSHEHQKKEWVKLSEIIDDIQLSISTDIISEKVKFNIDFSEIDELQTQKVYLYSIFYNLIINSIKYKRQNIPPEITIKSIRSDGRIKILFSDNGMGIDLQKKGNDIFGLYKRFHDHVEGKGIGLYMVKKQVESLNGKISVKSVVEEGTSFELEFNV